MKKLVVLSGAGVSAESGLKTFRDSGGLWEGHRVEEVATPEAWRRDPDLVLEFYNQRRKDLLSAQPNNAHLTIASLEDHYDVVVVTQNVDDLHERAGSSNVIHLHGELMKARSEKNEQLIYPMDGWELKRGALAEDGSQLRPHVVWFGEMVPMMEVAAMEVIQADHLLVIGTSLMVYPAAGLVNMIHSECELTLIDPAEPSIRDSRVKHYREMATMGMKRFVEDLGLR